MTARKDMPSDLCECALDVASGGATGIAIESNANSYEPVTRERGLRSDGELVQAVKLGKSARFHS